MELKEKTVIEIGKNKPKKKYRIYLCEISGRKEKYRTTYTLHLYDHIGNTTGLSVKKAIRTALVTLSTQKEIKKLSRNTYKKNRKKGIAKKGRKRWNKGEKKLVCTKHNKGMSVCKLAVEFKRTKNSIKNVLFIAKKKKIK